jgi:hypothetical protein
MNRFPTRSRRIGVCVVTVLAMALVPVAALASSAPPAGFVPKICGSFSGPKWSYKGQSGTSYIAYTINGGPCSFTMTWAQRLVDKHKLGKHFEIIGSPAGWMCGNASLPWFGLCAKTVGGHAVKGGRGFGWRPNTK